MPDIYNETHECTRHVKLAGRTDYVAMMCIMDCSTTTPERGLMLMPFDKWDGIDTDYKFKVTVRTDSYYAKCPDTRKSMTGAVVYLNRVPVIFRSSTQKQ